jgi:hypothetical protein
VLELEGQTPRAFYDVAGAEVNQMSASSPYLDLFARALNVVAGIDAGERRYELRLLRAPALNFEALWLHSGDGNDDKVIPLRSFHGLAAMQPISYHEALERLRGPAERIARQDDTMGA